MSSCISLAGKWSCRLDATHRGLAEGWQHGTEPEHEVLVTSLDLSSRLESRHAARQLRTSLETYVNSDAFSPALELHADAMDRLIAAHQQKPEPETREEVKARFDRMFEADTSAKVSI